MPDQSSVHWKRIYAERQIGDLSWTEAVPAMSLELIEQADLASDVAIVDVGGGASGLAAELLKLGYSVADISGEALERAKADFGEDADRVTWIEADVRDHDFGRHFDLWHDRAAFHFMVDAADRDGYLAVLRSPLSRSDRAAGRSTRRRRR